MALDAQDQARLQRIESALVSADPALARRFRSWQPSSRQRPLLPGWSSVPSWAAAVFVVAFAGWVLSPVLGVVVVIGIAASCLWQRVKVPVPPPRRGARRGGR